MFSVMNHLKHHSSAMPPVVKAQEDVRKYYFRGTSGNNALS
jgi:hypothetical protein